MSNADASLSPSGIDGLFQQALEHHRAGRVAEAAQAYQRVVAAAPAHYSANLNLGVALRRLKRPQEALAAYDRAVTLRPESASALANRGNLLRELGRLADALRDYDGALALQPDDPNLLATRAGMLQDSRRLDEALAGYDRALEIAPQLPQALNGRGTVLFALGRLEEALACYEQAIAVQPDMALAHRNRGVTLRRLGRSRDAIASHDRALALAPDDPEPYWARSICHLLLGNFEAGWRDYERRWEAREFLTGSAGEMTPAFLARLQHSLAAADLAGRDVLLLAEQGVGDVIMFASVIPDLLADARIVSLACEPRLRRLFSHAFPAVTLLDKDAAEARLASFDVVIGIGSLPSIYRRRVEDFPGAPYLSPSDEARRAWAGRLGPGDGRKRIGLSWRGGLDRTGRQARSIPLEAMRPILELPDCEFVSLQYGDHDAEIAAVNAGIERPIRTFRKAEVDDFEDLAAVVAELDLVISVQTSLVHLTGALGAPGLVMVPARAEWRYLDSGSSMPWYRSITLFRQAEDLDWAPVIARVAATAAARLGSD